MAVLETSSTLLSIKEALSGEWAAFKKDGKGIPQKVCPYAVGGNRDTPVSALKSVCIGVSEWEKLLSQAVETTVEKSRGVLPSEVTVGACGEVSLYPPRRPVVMEMEVVAAKKSKGKKTAKAWKGKVQAPEHLFMTAAEQSANYLLDHGKRCCQHAYSNGNNGVFYIVMGSALLIRSRLNTYKEALKLPNTKKFRRKGEPCWNLNETLGRCSEVVEFTMQSILAYHSDLLHSAVLHDADSSDWSNPKPYQENEAMSQSILMWAFHLQGLRNDLWRYTSPRISESILASIFTDSLALMVSRYNSIETSDMRLSQYHADVIAILVITANILPSLITSPKMMFSVRIHESLAFPIHRRAEMLLKITAIKCAPVTVLSRVFQNGFDDIVNRSGYPSSLTEIESTPDWLTFLNPQLYPREVNSLHQLPGTVAVYHTLLTAASRPQPPYHLIVRGLLMRKFLGARRILGQLVNAPGHVSAGKPCGGPLCLPHLCTPPLIPHTVYAAITQVLMNCVDWTPVLSTVMEKSIVNSANWSSLDLNQVWNLQRPPWHHALIQLVSPSVVGVVANVLRSVPPEPPGRPAHPSQLSVRLEHHLTAWTLQLLTGMQEVADMIPLKVIHIAHKIQTQVPNNIRPAGGHVISQLIASALYSIINSRSSLDELNDRPVTDGQWDMLIAVAERLNCLSDAHFDSHMKTLTHKIISQLEDYQREEELDSLDEYHDEEVVDSICMALSSQVLATTQGQHALLLIWEFLRQNMEWLQGVLDLPSILVHNSESPSPPVQLSFQPTPPMYNPLIYKDKFIYTTMDQESFLNFKCESAWEKILNKDLCLPKETIISLIKGRPEFQKEAILTDAQEAAIAKITPHLEDPEE